jgi:hypothetical protein
MYAQNEAASKTNFKSSSTKAPPRTSIQIVPYTMLCIVVTHVPCVLFSFVDDLPAQHVVALVHVSVPPWLVCRLTMIVVVVGQISSVLDSANIHFPVPLPPRPLLL